MKLKAPAPAPRADTAPPPTPRQMRRATTAEVAERGGRDISENYPEGVRAVEMVDGTVWVQSRTTGQQWSDIHEFGSGTRPGAPADGVLAAHGHLLLPPQAAIDQHRSSHASPSATRPGPHDLALANDQTEAAAAGLGVHATREERIQAIRDKAVELWGPRWEDAPGPRDAEWRDPNFLVRVPRYRYTPVGAVFGIVRLASYCVPLLGGLFRRMEDRLMYHKDRKQPRPGGAWDLQTGPNAALFGEWQKRLDTVGSAIARVDAEMIGRVDQPNLLKAGAVEQILGRNYTQALVHAPKLTACAADLLHRVSGAQAEADTPAWAVVHDPGTNPGTTAPAAYAWDHADPAQPAPNNASRLEPANVADLKPAQALNQLQALVNQLQAQAGTEPPAAPAPAPVPTAEPAAPGIDWQNLEPMPDAAPTARED